jgi:hypothetical protein
MGSCSVVETVQVGYRLVKQAQSVPQALFPERKFLQSVADFSACAEKSAALEAPEAAIAGVALPAVPQKIAVRVR